MKTPPILFLAVLFSLLTPSAQAGGYQVGSYHQSGEQITRTAPRQQSSTLLSQILNAKLLDDIVNQHEKSVSVSQDVKYRIGGSSGTLHDTYRIPAKPLAKRLGEAVKRNARGGVAGMIGGTAASLAIDYAIEKGWSGMDAMKCEVTRECWSKPSQPSDGKEGSGQLHRVPLPDGEYNDRMDRHYCDRLTEQLAQAKTLTRATLYIRYSTYSCLSFVFPEWNSKPAPKIEGCTFRTLHDQVASGRFLTRALYLCGKDFDPVRWHAGVNPAAPVTDDDIDKLADDLLKDKTQKVIEGFANDGTIIELDDNAESTVSGDPVTGPKSITDSKTETKADGTKVTSQTESQTTYTPKGGNTMGSPIGFEQTTSSTTTVNTCTGAGSCSTSTSNSTTVKPPPSEPQQTDCDKYPDSIGCSKWGDPPSVPIPEEERELKFTPKSFAMPATCPPNYEFTLSNGQHFSYSFEWFCKFATAIRALIILAALISAYFIIFGARKGEGS
ncbi:hypothetical protein K5M36_06050 [Chromobacterium vaccinii]|nr:hypothetical protein [Chromobacterium vaccinii]